MPEQIMNYVLMNTTDHRIKLVLNILLLIYRRFFKKEYAPTYHINHYSYDDYSNFYSQDNKSSDQNSDKKKDDGPKEFSKNIQDNVKNNLEATNKVIEEIFKDT